MTAWLQPADPSTGNGTMVTDGQDLDAHDAVGAYAVGALEPDQAGEFEDHLATCEQCAEELAGFRGFLRALAPLTDEMAREAAAAAQERQGVVVRIDSFRSRRPSSWYANGGSPPWSSRCLHPVEPEGSQTRASGATGTPSIRGCEARRP